MVRFVHTADWQLGMMPRSLSQEARGRFAEARIGVIRTIGALATEQNCEFVVVAGDVFESNQVDRATVRRALDAMKEADVPFYLLPANHDPLEPGSVFRADPFVANRPENVHVLEGGAALVVRPGVEIIAAPWLSKRPVRDLVAEACSDLTPLDAGVRVVVGHGAVDVLSPDSTSSQLIVIGELEAAIDRGCITYVALGDRHSTTDVGRSGVVWYSGAPEPTDFRETDPGNVLVVEAEHGRVSVEKHHTGAWQFVDHHADVNGVEDADQLRSWLDALSSKTTTVIQLRLVGTITLQLKAMLDNLVAEEANRFAAIRVAASSDIALVPDDADFTDLGLSGYAASTASSLRALASGPDPEVAQDALSLLFRLAKGSST
jgi:DNA repair exonuclease SbcCD nuclease subunit